MKTHLLLFLIIAATALTSQAQTSISGSGSPNPDAAAMLDVIANDKGMLIPRVALTSTTVAAPVTGLTGTSTSLLVYNTSLTGDVTPGFYYWNNPTASWIRIISGNANFPTGSGTQNYVTKWNNAAGTTIGNSQIFDNGTDVGIGTNVPTNLLHLYRNGSTPVLQLYSDRSAGSSSPAQLMENRILFGGVNNQGWSTPNGAGIDFHTNYPAETSTGRLNFWAYPNTSASPVLTVWNGNVGVGTTSPGAKLAVNGVASVGSGEKLSLIGLDINSGGTPSFIKILTNIPSASGSADFTVNIKGFRYGSAEMTNLTIGWHWYSNTFWNPSVSSSGSWAPVVKLSAEGGFVAIVLSSPGYWPKLYVESMYSSTYNDQYASGWSWADADASGSPIVTVPYKSNFGNDFVMLSDGKVGIGTASPGYKLHVPSGYIGTDYINTSDNVVGSGVSGIMVKAGDNFLRTGNAASVLSYLGVTAPTGDNLGNHTATTTLNMADQRIINARSFEINSGNLSGMGNQPYAIYREDGSWTHPYPDLRIAYHTGIKFGANPSYEGMRFYSDYDMSSLVMSVNDGSTGGAGNVYMTGSLGINTTSPAFRLDVTGNARIGATGGLTIASLSASRVNLRPSIGNGDILISDDSGTPARGLTVANGGSVGIGMDAPTRKLEVQGAIKLAYGNQIYFGENIGANGQIGINFHTDGDNNYYIGKPAGAWTQPLHIAFHTGVKIGAYTSYGGTRFYNNSDMATELMSIGNGDNHVRVANYLFAQYVNTSDNVVGSGVSGIMVKAGDNYMRTGNAASVLSYLGVTAPTGDNLGNHSATTTLTMNGNNINSVGDIFATQNYGMGLVGVYSDVRYQNVFAMGPSYRLAADGTTTGNLYGIAWTHSNIGGASRPGLGHQMLVMSNGDTRSVIGDGIWTKYGIETGSTGTYNRFNTWTDLTGHHGLYSSVHNGAHLYPNNGTYGAWKMQGNRGGWGGIEFGDPAGAGELTLMVGHTSHGWGNQHTGFHNNSQGWMWYFRHKTLVAERWNDMSDENYYVDPASTSNFNAVISYSYQGNGNVGGTGSASWHPSGIYSPGTNWLYGTSYMNTTYGYIWYDWDNTGYYLDPHSHSEMNEVYDNVHLTRSTTYTSYNSGTTYVGWNQPWGYCASCWAGTSCYWCGSVYYLSLRTPGAIEAGEYFYASDKKFKKNITTIPNALATIKQLRGVTYNRKLDLSETDDPEVVSQPDRLRTELGFIAQEVKEVLPELVQEITETDGKSETYGESHLSVKYGRIIPILVEAVKEQQQQIEELKQTRTIGTEPKNTNLQTQVDELKNQNRLLLEQLDVMKGQIDELKYKK